MAQAIPSSEYWANRAAKRMDGYMQGADAAGDVIAASYERAMLWYNEENEKLLKTFQGRFHLSEEEAKKLLADGEGVGVDVVNRLKKAIKKISDPEKRRMMQAEIDAPAYAFRMRRLRQSQENARKAIEHINRDENAKVTDHLSGLCEDAYLHSTFDIQQGLGTGYSFYTLPESSIKEILRQSWSGDHYSNRIWGNLAQVGASIQQEVLVGVLTGRSYKRTANEVARRFGVGASNARRLVRTESCYVANQAEMQSSKEIGIKKYKYHAHLDMRTSTMCAEMDGKVIPYDEAKVGVNYPPLHPNCRSFAVGHVDRITKRTTQRRAFDPVTGKNVLIPGDMTYNEWKKSLTVNEKSGKMQVDGGNMKINSIDYPIEQRRHDDGNPNAVLQFGSCLNLRQERLLEQLSLYDSRVTVSKKAVSMRDLCALTAYTGDEFALFTKGGERLVIRGNTWNVNINPNDAALLNASGYRWSGHTHPSVEINALSASDGDYEILEQFSQNMAAVYNSKGEYQIFDKR